MTAASGHASIAGAAGAVMVFGGEPPTVVGPVEKRSGKGRPRGTESQARSRELLRLVAAGTPFPAAVRAARVSPERVVALIADGAFRSTLVALLDQQAA